jgi:hydrophobic/amphiphilic exporter-1 (mainly G- bacteria), HAE1 family
MITSAIRRPVTVAMAYMTIAALGVAAWRNLPIELLPDTDLPRLTVSADWIGSSPEVIEAFLTSPLESEIRQVRGVETIESTSEENRTTINVEFGLRTDMEFARLELSERLAAFEDRLPVGAMPPTVSPYVPDEFQDQTRPLLQYTVTGPYTLEYMREYVDEEIIPALEELQGVGTIVAQGGRARILQVELDENRIQALGIQPALVRQRIQSLEIVTEAGAVDIRADAFRTLAIRQRAETADDVRRLPLLEDQGRIIRVGDVGRVFETWDDPTSYFRINGFPALSMYIFRAPRTNAVHTADEIKTRMDELQTQVPRGVSMVLDRDQSEDIRAQLSDLRNRAAIAAFIVLFVLLLFLRSARAAIIVFATVAFAVLITLNLMYFGNFTLNVLTLMGLAMGFGLVVDNAIVVLENIYRYRRQGMNALDAAREGARDVAIPILAATGTTIVVLIPFVYLQGELRIYYVPLAIVVGLSLIASLLVAFSFIPALGSRLLSRVQPRTGAEAAEGTPHLAPPPARPLLIVRLYSGLVRLSLRHPWATVVLAVSMLGGSYYLFDKYVTRNVLWRAFGTREDTYIDIRIIQPRGEELERTDELARFFEEKLRRMPEVAQFTSRIQAQYGNINVEFPEELKYTSVPVAIKEQMTQYSLLFGGTDVRVYGYGPSFYGGGGGSSPNYSIKILGYNYETVREIAEDLGNRLTRFSRIREVDTNSAGSWFQRDRVTEIVVDVDRAKLALHDLSAQDVVSYVAATVRGRNLPGNVRVGGEEMRLSVKLQDYDRVDLFTLQETLIPGTGGEFVRLGDIATIRERQVLNRVIRENQQYQRIVSYEFRGPSRLGDRVKESVVAATMLPPGYTIEDSQIWSWSTEEKQQIWGVLSVSIILVFMVTAAVFESLRQPLCVLLTVPMALIGVFLVFFYTNAAFTREAWIGVIMMGGIVVNNAILLVDHVNQLRRRHGLVLEEALIRGTIERVRPILMTSLTTVCGLLPLVLFAESANANIWNALAYALIGGLSSSTFLVLTVTPALYLLFESPRAPWRGLADRVRARRERRRAAKQAAAEPTPAPA